MECGRDSLPGNPRRQYGFVGTQPIRAVYYNHGDLGVARDMNCNATTINGLAVKACYVSNYGRKQDKFPHGPAGFGPANLDPQTALQQVLAPQSHPPVSPNAPLATVAMVYNTALPADTRVQFMVYTEDGQLTPEAALDAWPEIELPSGRFLAHLARRFRSARDDSPCLDDLRKLRASDLYITCACANGDGRAIATFERVYFGEVDRAVARVRAGSAVADDVKQTMRRMLFVPRSGCAPAIEAYAGRGGLRGWVRISARRAALHLVNQEKREVALDDEDLLQAISPEDPELDYLRARYHAALTSAFRDALAATSAEHRRLLLYQLVDAFSVDDLARLYNIHRATAARRVAAAREEILERTRLALAAAIGLPSTELDGVIRLLYSHLDVNIERTLR